MVRPITVRTRGAPELTLFFSIADAELHLRQPDYCTFRSVRALSVTWNVDSHRPTDLQGPVDNLEFLRNVLTSVDSPDIISFGFQEMVSCRPMMGFCS